MAALSTTDNNCGVAFPELKTDSGIKSEKSDYQNLIKNSKHFN